MRKRSASGRRRGSLAVGLGVGFLALGLAVGIGAVALLELGEVLGHERAVFLGDAGDVGAGVVDPGPLGGIALGEEDDVGLDALAVGGERAARQPQDGVQVAVLA